MNKKKILSLCLIVCLLATAVVGGTLAYFTDTDAQKNVFTAGNVKIDLYENFTNNNGGIATMVPAVIYNDDEIVEKIEGDYNDYDVKNSVTKEIYVKNIGSEEAYVRVYIAVPSLLIDNDGSYTKDDNSITWHRNYKDGNGMLLLAKPDDNDWDKNNAANVENMYRTTIDGHYYTIYVLTYTKALAPAAVTKTALDYVYMNPGVTNEDVTEAKGVLGENWNIYVVAEGVQVDGFEEVGANKALDTAFGVPGSYTIDFKATAENQEWVVTSPNP